MIAPTYIFTAEHSAHFAQVLFRIEALKRPIGIIIMYASRGFLNVEITVDLSIEQMRSCIQGVVNGDMMSDTLRYVDLDSDDYT